MQHLHIISSVSVKHLPNDDRIVIEQTGMLGPYDSSFRTFDAFDFTPLGKSNNLKFYL